MPMSREQEEEELVAATYDRVIGVSIKLLTAAAAAATLWVRILHAGPDSTRRQVVVVDRRWNVQGDITT